MLGACPVGGAAGGRAGRRPDPARGGGLPPVEKRREAAVRTAAPDYLQKANEALTGLLNQEAETFQEQIAPMQQALQVVQQAMAEQQQKADAHRVRSQQVVWH